MGECQHLGFSGITRHWLSIEIMQIEAQTEKEPNACTNKSGMIVSIVPEEEKRGNEAEKIILGQKRYWLLFFQI